MAETTPLISPPAELETKVFVPTLKIFHLYELSEDVGQQEKAILSTWGHPSRWYYVFKETDNAYLIGDSYELEKSIKSGWVAKSQVFRWDTAIALRFAEGNNQVAAYLLEEDALAKKNPVLIGPGLFFNRFSARLPLNGIVWIDGRFEHWKVVIPNEKQKLILGNLSLNDFAGGREAYIPFSQMKLELLIQKTKMEEWENFLLTYSYASTPSELREQLEKLMIVSLKYYLQQNPTSHSLSAFNANFTTTTMYNISLLDLKCETLVPICEIAARAQFLHGIANIWGSLFEGKIPNIEFGEYSDTCPTASASVPEILFTDIKEDDWFFEMGESFIWLPQEYWP